MLGSLGEWLVEGTIDGRALPEGLRLVLGSSKIGCTDGDPLVLGA